MERTTQESAVWESRLLRLTRRELETWLWWNCAPTPQAKAWDWKPSTYGRRANSRPYFNGRHEGTYGNATHLVPTQLECGISFVKLLGRDFSLRYPEAWLICAPNPLIWEVEAEV